MKIRNKKMLLFLIGGVIALVLLGGTFAYWSWRLDVSQRTTITLTYDKGFSCTADGGGDITSQDKQLIPASCTNTNYAIQRTVTVTPQLTSVDAIALNLKLKIDSISQVLSGTEHFKYAFTKDSSSCTTDVITDGSFYGKEAGDTVDLLAFKEYILSEPDVYYLYIWLDSEETNNATMDQHFSFTVGGGCISDTVTELTYINGSYRTFTAPLEGYYKIELWGAQGGTSMLNNALSSLAGGKGGYTSGYIYLNQGEVIYAYVGGKGGNGLKAKTRATAGYNGGGTGAHDNADDEVYGGDGLAKITYIGTTMERKNLVLNGVRYIKNCVNGSSSTTNNLWVEIQAVKDGVNIAKGKSVTGTVSADSSYPYTRIVDGSIDTEIYAKSGSNGYQCVTVDLDNTNNGVTYDLDEIAVWHYYDDGRTFYDNETYVSEDGITWDTVISGNYAESSTGKHINAWE